MINLDATNTESKTKYKRKLPMVKILQSEKKCLYYWMIFIVHFVMSTCAQDTTGVARFIIINRPSDAVVKADEEIINHDIGGWYTVSAGEKKIQIYKNDSVVFSSNFNFKQNEEKRIVFDCSIDCAGVEINSSPSEAQLFIDDEDYGMVPYQNYYTKPGKHKIKLNLPGYKPINEEISLSTGNIGKHSFLLEHSKAYKDSIASVKLKEKRARQRWRKVIFGVVTASLAGTGIYYEIQARSSVSDANQMAMEYDNATADFAHYKKSYSEYRKDAKKSIDLRNILLGAAGMAFAGFGFSFIF